MFVVGLTGGIGSGKSSVGALFEAHGVEVIDADAISRALTAPGGGAIAAIRAEFGAQFIDAQGALDRARMRALAFAEPAARRRLEAILHPMIRAETDRRMRAARSPYVILMIPLLIESGAPRSRCHRIAVVDVPEDMQIERVLVRDGLPRPQIDAIMRSQAARSERLAAADDVIDNSGDRKALVGQVLELHRRYLALAAANRSS